MYDTIVIGCGFAGAVTARELADNNEKVLIIERRDHIGGNCYDALDEYGIMIHEYGPHIFHTYDQSVYDYLSRFTEWYNYSHEVAGNIYGNIVPIPFNLNTLELVYGEDKAKELKEKLTKTYGMDSRVSIMQLRQNQDEDIKGIADYVYENIFLKYTMKQWGKTPEEIDIEVMNRVPVLISYDNRYFQDTYQGMPKDGYTELFRNLLHHNNIMVQLSTEAKDFISIEDKNGVSAVYYKGELFRGKIIYTGAIDEFFDCRFGRLPYRSLKFVTEHFEKDYYQSHGVVNYTVSEDFTRITEYKYFTNQQSSSTTIMKEYPFSYSGKEGEIPYYSIANEENHALYEKYADLVRNIPDFYLLGRLAEYKYYNIDAIVLRALALSKELCKKKQ